MSLLYILLAILGLGVLVFVHEFGHYLAALWVGMRVEAFSIGFGKPIYHWQMGHTEWRIGWLPFGGYVRIAGMEKEDGKDPEDIPDGFYGKKPIHRFIVAAAGPFINLAFAFLLFVVLWGTGGREKTFSAYTNIVGYVDPHSALYEKGLRPGDKILSYDGMPFRGSKDHLYAANLGGSSVVVDWVHVDRVTGEEIPYSDTVESYSYPGALEQGIKTLGVMDPASYVFSTKLAGGERAGAAETSPMKDSGIKKGDRLLWVDGEIVYSQQQLRSLLNDSHVLLTVQRGDKTLLFRVPRVTVGQLKIDTEHKDELTDWQYDAELEDTKFLKLSYIPYNLDNYCRVENALPMIDAEQQERVFPKYPYSPRENPLQKGDLIIAVDGTPVKRTWELLQHLQGHVVHVIVDRSKGQMSTLTWPDGDAAFLSPDKVQELETLAATIGTPSQKDHVDSIFLLNPVTPKRRLDLALTPEQKVTVQTQFAKQRQAIESMSDADQRHKALTALEDSMNELVLGFYPADRTLLYNPGPTALFYDVAEEVWRTMQALVVGDLNPKFMAGPIGIVQVMQTSWGVSIKEALFWLGAISLNLGVLNLIPIPLLDGGYLCMSLYEMATGRRLKPKIVERMIIPFAVIVIGLMIFLTFNDVTRIFTRFFHG